MLLPLTLFFVLPLQVSLYLDKFSGICQPALHDCKLTFLQIICDHDLFVEMPGRDPSDRYLTPTIYCLFPHLTISLALTVEL